MKLAGCGLEGPDRMGKAETQSKFLSTAELAAIEAKLDHASHGLAALKALIDDIEAKLDSPVFGLQEIKNEIIVIDNEIAVIDAEVAAIEAKLDARLDVAISTRAVPGDAMALTPAERLIVQALIINDLTPFAGADIAAILADTATIAWGDITGIIADIGVFPTANYATLAAYVEDIRTRLIAIQADIVTIDGIVDDIETKLDLTEILLKFPSAESFNDFAAVGPTNTTAMPIVVAIPAGATIRRAMLAAFITVMNDTANLQKIDVDVQGRVPLGAWNTYFSQNDCIGVPNVDAATTGFVPVQDVSAMVNVAGTYEFRCAVTQTAANSVHYTINYVLIITYRMS